MDAKLAQEKKARDKAEAVKKEAEEESEQTKMKI